MVDVSASAQSIRGIATNPLSTGAGCSEEADPLSLAFTGERIVPGRVPEELFEEHEARYVFAGKFVPGKVVLDIACGTGIGTSYLRKAGARVCYGLDIDRSAIEYARAAYGECIFDLSDALDIKLANNLVDTVVSFETIEHLADQRNFLMECRRVLKPGGLLICSTPNRDVYRWWGKNPFHVTELSTAEFKRLADSIFQEVELYSQREKIFLVHVARRLLLRGLDGLQLKASVKKILGRQAAAMAIRNEFSETSGNVPARVVRHRLSPFVQPTFVIAVCRK